MSEAQKLATGVPGLDFLLGGGITQGRAALIAGRSGTCKTVLSLQIACQLARAGKRVLFVSIEESPSDLRGTGDDLRFGASELIAAGQLKIVDMVQPFDGPQYVSGSFDISGLIARLQHARKEHRADVVVLDSVTALFAPIPQDPRLRYHFFQLIHSLKQEGTTVLATAEALEDYGPVAALGMEDFVSDVVIILRNVIDGKRRRRTVEVLKYRRSAHFKGEYPIALTSQGLLIFPLDLEASDEMREVTRFSSGSRPLDRMTGGGWPRDNIVLVRGPTGSGKTTLAAMYACAGAQRGERVFYYGFEETREMLLRNLRSLKLSLKDHESSGNVKVVCRFPEATSPEDLIIELRAVLAEYKPSLIVLDSISAIEHVSSAETFRHFMIGITSALRQHGRSALMTQTVSASAQIDSVAPYMSTMADAILLLQYDLTRSGQDRYLRVLKIRGSPFDAAPRRFDIRGGGIQVKRRGKVADASEASA